MRLKKVLIYFLIVVFAVSNSAGVIIIYNQIKFYHKRAIKEQIKENNFNQIVEILGFSKKDLLNGKIKLDFIEEHEFKYNGKMYDIITKWESGDSIYYKCINDTKEENLEAVFVSYIVNNDHRQDLPLPIKQLLSLLQTEFFVIQDLNNFLQQNYSISISLNSENPLDFCLIIPDPPPRLFFQSAN